MSMQISPTSRVAIPVVARTTVTDRDGLNTLAARLGISRSELARACYTLALDGVISDAVIMRAVQEDRAESAAFHAAMTN